MEITILIYKKMSSGVFGSIRPAIIDVNRDVDIFYKYRPSRGETDPDFKGYKRVDDREVHSRREIHILPDIRPAVKKE